MRIVGGSLKSRRLCEFKGDFIRPTSDSARESLFNILRDRTEGSSFLDLYCGTGAVGIEAYSRGAETVVFNDVSKESLAVLRKNLERLGIADRVQVKNTDARAFIESCARKFDIIFMDPPYDFGEDMLPEGLYNALNEGGIAVYESEKPFSGELAGLKVTDRRRYGRAHLTFFKRAEER